MRYIPSQHTAASLVDHLGLPKKDFPSRAVSSMMGIAFPDYQFAV
jgi:hypothetical protein